jgi:hypothetical protein
MYSRVMVELETKIRAQEKTLGDDHPDIAESLAQLAHLYFIFGRYGECERLFWRAISICSAHYGQEHESVAGLLVDLGYLMETEERWPEAEHVYRLAYAIRTINGGAAQPESLRVGRLVVRVVRAQGKMPAERELERMAKIAV